MKTILTAVDFSDCSLKALEYAAYLADKLEAELSIIHVCKPYEKKLYYPDTKKQEKKETEKKLSDLVSKYQGKLKTKVSSAVREGKVYKEVVNQAKYSDAYIIVAGTHGISGFEEFFMGSNAYRILSAAPCPVLTVTADFKLDGIDKILLPIDSSIESRQKTMFTAEVAKKLNATVNILGVFNSNDSTIKNRIKQYCNQIVTYLGKRDINNTLEFSEETNIADAALSYADKLKPGLISIMSEADPYALRWILGSNAQKMVHHTRFPILCMHPKKEYKYPTEFSGTV